MANDPSDILGPEEVTVTSSGERRVTLTSSGPGQAEGPAFGQNC